VVGFDSGKLSQTPDAGDERLSEAKAIDVVRISASSDFKRVDLFLEVPAEDSDVTESGSKHHMATKSSSGM
jgi:hypothetical protein